jgi:hypothetical protein
LAEVEVLAPTEGEPNKDETLSMSNFKRVQQLDPVLQQLINYLELQKLPGNEKLSQQIVLEMGQMDLDEEGLLQHFWWMQHSNQCMDTHCQLVVPSTLTEAVMAAAHNYLLTSHFREKCTIKWVQQHYWWRGMFSQIKCWVATCPTCQQHNNPKGRTSAFYNQSPPQVNHSNA